MAGLAGTGGGFFTRGTSSHAVSTLLKKKDKPSNDFFVYKTRRSWICSCFQSDFEAFKLVAACSFPTLADS